METVITTKTTITIEVKKGIPCAKHAPLNEGCKLDCRRCLTAEKSEKLISRLLAGYLRKPELKTETRVVRV